MGMYNEVFKRCPRCGRTCYMQISQITLGFGNFRLDDPESMSDLTQSEKEDLAEILNSEESKFWCNGQPDEDNGCGHSFSVSIKVSPPKPRLEISI